MHIPNQFPTETYSILADKAFPLVKEIMTPYKGHPANLTPGQRKFNRNLNSKRQVSCKCVDITSFRSFGHLKIAVLSFSFLSHN